MAKSTNYWDKRAIKRMTEAEKSSEEYIKRIKNIYNQAYRNIDRELASVYRNYSLDTGLNTAKLKELLTRSETKKTWDQMKHQGLDKYIQDNYKSRISRLEQIQAQIYAKAKMIYPKEELEQTMCYKGVINDSYYKAVYDTQMGTGYDFSFNKIDNNTLNAVLNEKWSGKNYSQRIWTNTDILADSVSQIVGGGLLSGQSIQRTAKQIRDRFNVGKYYSERLVRTETNHFNNEADAMAYEEMGVNEYVFVATLDSRTSEICQDHDNKVFKFSEREVGVNFPPLHPNCRSTTRGYLGAEAEKMLKRRARNPITNKTEMVDNISYKEWARQNGIAGNKNGMISTQNGVIINSNSLRSLDKTLVKSNIDQLNKLINKYPKIAEFIKENKFYFGARNIDAIAITSHTWDMKELGIYLSKEDYKDLKTYQNMTMKAIKTNWSMPSKDINNYGLNHEFGHLVENYLINVYNKSNVAEYLNYKTRIRTATDQNKKKLIIKAYEDKICDKIAQDIYDIAIKDNPKFDLNKNLSTYGRESSQEFFAECFANMIGGKPNELGKAMKKYLKGVM